MYPDVTGFDGYPPDPTDEEVEARHGVAGWTPVPLVHPNAVRIADFFPVAPAETGQIVYSTADDRLSVFDGRNWLAVK